MGRKSIRTGRTTEQHETKVCEVRIDLDRPVRGLPIDLQTTVGFPNTDKPEAISPSVDD